MTINLTDEVPSPKNDAGEWTSGQQATLFCSDDGSSFWYRRHGVTPSGNEFETEDAGPFGSRAEAMNDALDQFRWGVGC